jgi:hypothetical protein
VCAVALSVACAVDVSYKSSFPKSTLLPLGMSFYLIVAAGACQLAAVACSTTHYRLRRACGERRAH